MHLWEATAIPNAKYFSNIHYFAMCSSREMQLVVVQTQFVFAKREFQNQTLNPILYCIKYTSPLLL